jgi:hypothetical protein
MHQQVLACAEAGVAGYVGRDGSERDLVAAAQYALRGELYCSASIAAILSRYIALMSAQASISDEQVALTRREQQILDLIGEGMSNKEIGRASAIPRSRITFTTFSRNYKCIDAVKQQSGYEANKPHRAGCDGPHSRPTPSPWVSTVRVLISADGGTRRTCRESSISPLR